MANTEVTISIENLAPENGTAITPLWFGFHDGTFDTYDRGRPVSPGLESLAEDGDTELISQEFDLAGFGAAQGVIPGPEGTPGPIDPGEITTLTLELDGSDPSSRFFNYAAMILPSNDFFIANGNEQGIPVFDEDGNFIGADFIVLGSSVLDAGSEVNDEIPENTAFFGQTVPDTGTPENGVVQLAEGFIPDGPILSSEDFSNADFTAEGYQVARIRVFAESLDATDISGDNTLTGSAEEDAINGRSGNDTLSGLGGDDTLRGARGNDVLIGGGGADTLIGGQGDDSLIGGSDNDTLKGGAGNDRLDGGDGDDVIRTGPGNDEIILRAGAGVDTIFRFSTRGDDQILLENIGFDEIVLSTGSRNTEIVLGEEVLAVVVNNTSLVEADFSTVVA
ncbi:MAG: spondin domain-containing protein [Cyanobacteria bacterium P01_A01_bin.135]